MDSCIFNYFLLYLDLKYGLTLYQTSNNTVDYFRFQASSYVDASCSSNAIMSYGLYYELGEKVSESRYKVKIVRSTMTLSSTFLKVFTCIPKIDPDVEYPAQ